MSLKKTSQKDKRDMGTPEAPWQTFSLCYHGLALTKALVASLRLPQRRHDGKVAVANSNQQTTSRIVAACIEHIVFHRYL
ncbi:hypothetical protein LMG28614_05930 [Paraburkholderia ultramafica]|uniref:Uncharacterized protein n=1 Tax=Paraburkholderia ultramafica TaxID=1544867 RepID=A0A6S7BKV8_9BURK|nr:hypothetical protein LMG28614_05930 [Paraburkholderia ultramafica]